MGSTIMRSLIFTVSTKTKQKQKFTALSFSYAAQSIGQLAQHRSLQSFTFSYESKTAKMFQVKIIGAKSAARCALTLTHSDSDVDTLKLLQTL